MKLNTDYIPRLDKNWKSKKTHVRQFNSTFKIFEIQMRYSLLSNASA